MAHGLEVYSSAGAVKLTVTDRLTHLVQQDNQAFWTWTGSGHTRFFPVTGMVDDGSWLVFAPWNDVIAWVSTGGYYVRLVYGPPYAHPTFPVTIYRC